MSGESPASWPDADLRPVLADFATTPERMLGQGGEASVFGLDGDRVLRLSHRGHRLADARRRARLLADLAGPAQALPFAIPQAEETGQRRGIVYTIERRIPGQSVEVALRGLGGAERAGLIGRYFAAADLICRLGRADRFTELGHQPPVAGSDYAAFLAALITRSARWAGVTLDGDAIAAGLPAAEGAELVHLDFFPGNVMTRDGRITGVLDFGFATLMADRRLTPLAAAVSLQCRAPLAERDLDRETVRTCLRDRGLLAHLAGARRFLAAYWIFAAGDDPGLAAWARPELGL